MHALLDRIGIRRSEVMQLAPPAKHGREVLVSEALRPAATTERWQARTDSKAFAAAADNALTSLSMIEAANAEEEALAIAVVLREAVESQDKTVALVTPDRALARRVVAALERWHVAVDDSGGDALADTPAGVFARLAAEAALGGLEPVTLLALLKHPLLRLSAKEGAHNVAIATLERSILRGPRPSPGSDALSRAISTFRANRDELHRSDPRWLIADDEFDVAAELIARLGAALAPLERLKRGNHSLAALATCHSAVISGLGRDAKGDVAAFAGHDGTALARAFEELSESPSAADLAVAKTDYAELFHAVNHRRPRGAPAGNTRRARAFLRAVGSAPADFRPRRARRPQRGHLATRDAQRSLAEPPDAPRSWPRSAGAHASAFPRTISPKAWAPRKSSSAAPPRSPAARP